MAKQGRPTISQEELDDIVRKITPYLRTGISLKKSILAYNSENEDSISVTTAYKYYGADEEFTNQIDREMNYLSVVTSNVFYNLLIRIANKFNEDKPLTKEEKQDLKWFALNSKVLNEEFGQTARVEHTGEKGKPIKVETPTLDAWLAGIAKEFNDKANK